MANSTYATSVERLEAASAAWLRDLEEQGRLSRTVEAYASALADFTSFFGADEELSFEKMAQILSGMGQKRITCNQAYCMEPKKSVMFLADFSGGKPKGDSCKETFEKEKRSEKHTGICASCHNKECIYRR